MKLTRKQLKEAVEEKIITEEQAGRLYNFLKVHPTQGPAFNFTNILYYMGGLTAIGAMSLFMNLGWETFGGWGIFFISSAYAGAGLYLADSFRKRGYDVPAGICAAFVIVLTPLAIYGVQQAMGWWPDHSVYRDYHRYIRWHWIYMELGTLAVGAIMAWIYRYPFLFMPVAATLWYMSMDIAPLIAGADATFSFRTTVSMWFGLANIFLALLVDIRSKKGPDYAFWLYMSGVTAFWGSMMSRFSDHETSRLIALFINIILVGTGVVLVRRIFVIFGAMGCAFYLGHIAYTIFKNSWLFPFALSFAGLIIIYLGILWQKNEQLIISKTRRLLPDFLRELIAEKNL